MVIYWGRQLDHSLLNDQMVLKIPSHLPHTRLRMSLDWNQDINNFDISSKMNQRKHPRNTMDLSLTRIISRETKLNPLLQQIINHPFICIPVTSIRCSPQWIRFDTSRRWGKVTGGYFSISYSIFKMLSTSPTHSNFDILSSVWSH